MKKNINYQTTRLKFLFVLFLSNASIFLMLSGDREMPTQCSHINKYTRKDYVNIKVNAELKTDFNINAPVTLTDSTMSFIVKHAFILKEYPQTTQMIGLTQKTKQYLVEVKKSDFNLLVSAKQIVIYSHEINIPTKNKKRSYEINF